MSDFRTRLDAERVELKEKIGKLDAFTLTTVFASLHPTDRDLLYRQVGHMRDYAEVLDERAARLG